jgi:Leucine-rich repeat (LRR) protein
VWTPQPDQRVITSVEVLQTCDLSKVKWASFTSNVESLDELKPYLSQLNPVDLMLYPEQRLTTVPEEIMQMTNLEDLTLSFNQIESIPSSIRNLKNLKKLSLQFNKLKSLPPEIYELKLKELDLRDNKFDLKTLLEIKSKMPNTKLIFKD